MKKGRPRKGNWLDGPDLWADQLVENASLERAFPKLSRADIEKIANSLSEQFSESKTGDPSFVLANVARAIRVCQTIANAEKVEGADRCSRDAIRWHNKAACAFDEGMKWSEKRQDVWAMSNLSRVLVYAIYLGGAAAELRARVAFPRKPSVRKNRISRVSAAVDEYRRDRKNNRHRIDAKGAYEHLHQPRPPLSTFKNWFSEWKKITKCKT